jgi:hypothetical protein
MQMRHTDWIPVITGVIFIAIGIAFATSRAFASLALAFTSQGNFWTRWLGEKWAALVAKYLFSVASIAAGLWYIYVGAYGDPG